MYYLCVHYLCVCIISVCVAADDPLVQVVAVAEAVLRVGQQAMHVVLFDGPDGLPQDVQDALTAPPPPYPHPPNSH